MGTTKYLLMPNNPMPDASPANSATMFPKSAKPNTNDTKNVARIPNSSRIRSCRPLPVTAPMRAAIS